MSRSQAKDSSSPYKLRMIVVGNSGVGKSSVVSQYVESEFDGDMIGTVGINFKNKTVQIDNKTLQLQIWDTAGEERYWSITPAYCRKADGVILIYDITNSKTFESILFWKGKVIEYSPEGVELMLVGNKLDMKNERAISEDTGREAASRIGSSFFEVSAMTGENIPEAFEALAKAIVRRKDLSEHQRSRCYPYRIDEGIVSVGDEDDGTVSVKSKPSCCRS